MRDLPCRPARPSLPRAAAALLALALPAAARPRRSRRARRVPRRIDERHARRVGSPAPASRPAAPVDVTSTATRRSATVPADAAGNAGGALRGAGADRRERDEQTFTLAATDARRTASPRRSRWPRSYGSASTAAQRAAADARCASAAAASPTTGPRLPALRRAGSTRRTVPARHADRPVRARSTAQAAQFPFAPRARGRWTLQFDQQRRAPSRASAPIAWRSRSRGRPATAARDRRPPRPLTGSP